MADNGRVSVHLPLCAAAATKLESRRGVLGVSCRISHSVKHCVIAQQWIDV
jgi:hypothetical protein